MIGTKRGLPILISVVAIWAMTFNVHATTISLQPTGGLNDGTDTGTPTSGKDIGYANGPSSASSSIHWISNPTWAGPGRAYFQFDPLSVVGGSTTVTSATLTLTNMFRLGTYYSSWPRSETLILETINGAWSENAVNSYLGTTALTSTLVDPNSWANIADPLGGNFNSLVGSVTFDITGLVQNWINTPGGNYGVAYGIGGSSYPYNTIDPYVFTSDAAGDLAAYRPVLNITFDGGEQIPEPTTLALYGIGLLGMWGARHRRRH